MIIIRSSIINSNKNGALMFFSPFSAFCCLFRSLHHHPSYIYYSRKKCIYYYILLLLYQQQQWLQSSNATSSSSTAGLFEEAASSVPAAAAFSPSSLVVAADPSSSAAGGTSVAGAAASAVAASAVTASSPPPAAGAGAGAGAQSVKATRVWWRGELLSLAGARKPAAATSRARSRPAYSWSQGSVLLKPAKANGLAASRWKGTDEGSMSISAIAPPGFTMRLASANISRVAAAGSSWFTRQSETRSWLLSGSPVASAAPCRKCMRPASARSAARVCCRWRATATMCGDRSTPVISLAPGKVRASFMLESPVEHPRSAIVLGRNPASSKTCIMRSWKF
mmetsp:Transcript_9401/g.13140  ORF Transcript_9401/g.13140 Transcript_9401/m.13140 type:complete len:338 (+) Transcript_9401:49-1062(+)